MADLRTFTGTSFPQCSGRLSFLCHSLLGPVPLTVGLQILPVLLHRTSELPTITLPNTSLTLERSYYNQDIPCVAKLGSFSDQGLPPAFFFPPEKFHISKSKNKQMVQNPTTNKIWDEENRSLTSPQPIP